MRPSFAVAPPKDTTGEVVRFHKYIENGLPIDFFVKFL